MGCRKRSAANGVSIKGPPAPGPLDTLINYGPYIFNTPFLRHPIFNSSDLCFVTCSMNPSKLVPSLRS